MKKYFMHLGIAVAFLIAGLIFFRNPSHSDEQTPPTGLTDLGKTIYRDRCAMCHGDSGKGNGPAAPFLHPRPREFTAGALKFRTTESGSIPTDADLDRTITN